MVHAQICTLEPTASRGNLSPLLWAHHPLITPFLWGGMGPVLMTTEGEVTTSLLTVEAPLQM